MPNWQQVSSAATSKSTVQMNCQEKVSLKKIVMELGWKKKNNHTFFIKTLLILHKLQYRLLKRFKRNINSSTVAAKALQNNREKKKEKSL